MKEKLEFLSFLGGLSLRRILDVSLTENRPLHLHGFAQS